MEQNDTQSIQVPDTDNTAVRVDMNEVQIHLKFPGYDIAIPVDVARMLADATTYLVEQVGGPLTPGQVDDIKNLR